MRSGGLAGAFVLVAAASGSSCLVDDGESPGRAWCSALCDAERTCYAVDSCEGFCLTGNAGYIERMRAEQLEREMACFASWLGCDIEEMLYECYVSAADESVATMESANFCLAMAGPFFECGWYSSPDTCARSFGAFADGALGAAAAHCSSAECYELEFCINRWIWE